MLFYIVHFKGLDVRMCKVGLFWEYRSNNLTSLVTDVVDSRT